MLQFENKHDRYNHSLKGLERNRRYDLTEKARIKRERFYAKHGGGRAYDVDRYHRIQEEAGCYMHIMNFYPGFRLIKALETAEVVEI